MILMILAIFMMGNVSFGWEGVCGILKGVWSGAGGGEVRIFNEGDVVKLI